jgi:anaerobic magnesium-protoporphyrin IX monomethyl ester cyclase
MGGRSRVADIVFVYNDVTAHTRYTCGLGVASIASHLARHGLTSELVYYRRESDLPYALDRVRRADPCLVGFYGPSSGFPALQRLSMAIRRQAPGLFQACGGPHVTLRPESLLETPSLDAVCIGYGERPLLELAQRLRAGRDLAGIEGFWVARRDGQIGAGATIERNPPSVAFGDADELLGFDHGLFLRELARFPDFSRERQRLEIIFARGCSYRCAFCSNVALRKVMGPHIPRPSVEASIRVVKESLAATGLTRVAFHDDNFTLDRKWFRSFVARYADEVRVPFSCNLRADGFDAQDARLLAEAGAERIYVGVESGNAHLRNAVMRKGVSDEAIVRGFKLLENAGIPAVSQNIIGTPGETPAMFLDTVRLNARVATRGAIISVFYPYPGTELAEYCDAHGLLSKRLRGSRERNEDVLCTPQFPPARIGFYRRSFALLIRYERLHRAHPVLLPVPLTPRTAAPIVHAMRLHRRTIGRLRAKRAQPTLATPSG